MQTTLQDQYKLITEGKGHKDVFLKSAQRLFPQYITNYASYDEAVNILKKRSVITEHNIGGVVTTSPNKQPNWFKIFNEGLYSLDVDGSDGDWEDVKDTKIRAEKIYDQGQELFDQGKEEEAEKLYQQSLEVGNALGWDENDLPPYTKSNFGGMPNNLEENEDDSSEHSEDEIENIDLVDISQDGGNIFNIIGGLVYSDTYYGKDATYEELYNEFENLEDEFEAPKPTITIDEFINKCQQIQGQIKNLYIDDPNKTPVYVFFDKNGVKWFDEENSKNPKQDAINQTKNNLNESKEVKPKQVKVVEKDTTKDIVDSQTKNYDFKTKENRDNVFGQEFLNGYYTELRDPKNIDKTEEELKAIVTKNLTKDSLFYVKDGQFGTKGVGYKEEGNGINKPVEAKGKYKSSGYGDLEDKKSTIEKSNTKSTLGDQEANTKMPSKVKEMETKPQSSKGVQKMKDGGTKWKIVKINEETSPLIPQKQKEDELTKLMSRYDWYYEMSDDLNKGEQGQLYHDKIMKLVVQLGQKGKDIFNLFAPKDRSLKETKNNKMKNLKESKLRQAISKLIKEELDLKEIDTLGEDAGKIAKIRKIDEEISKRSKKLKALNTLKELEDDAINPTKIKELNNEIKKLTQLKEKLSKSKSSKEEIVVDETKDKKMKPKSIKEDDSAIDKQIKDMSIKLAQLKKSKADADLNAATK